MLSKARKCIRARNKVNATTLVDAQDSPERELVAANELGAEKAVKDRRAFLALSLTLGYSATRNKAIYV